MPRLEVAGIDSNTSPIYLPTATPESAVCDTILQKLKELIAINQQVNSDTVALLQELDANFDYSSLDKIALSTIALTEKKKNLQQEVAKEIQLLNTSGETIDGVTCDAFTKMSIADLRNTLILTDQELIKDIQQLKQLYISAVQEEKLSTSASTQTSSDEANVLLQTILIRLGADFLLNNLITQKALDEFENFRTDYFKKGDRRVEFSDSVTKINDQRISELKKDATDKAKIKSALDALDKLLKLHSAIQSIETNTNVKKPVDQLMPEFIFQCFLAGVKKSSEYKIVDETILLRDFWNDLIKLQLFAFVTEADLKAVLIENLPKPSEPTDKSAEKSKDKAKKVTVKDKAKEKDPATDTKEKYKNIEKALNYFIAKLLENTSAYFFAEFTLEPKASNLQALKAHLPIFTELSEVVTKKIKDELPVDPAPAVSTAAPAADAIAVTAAQQPAVSSASAAAATAAKPATTSAVASSAAIEPATSTVTATNSTTASTVAASAAVEPAITTAAAASSIADPAKTTTASVSTANISASLAAAANKTTNTVAAATAAAATASPKNKYSKIISGLTGANLPTIHSPLFDKRFKNLIEAANSGKAAAPADKQKSYDKAPDAKQMPKAAAPNKPADIPQPPPEVASAAAEPRPEDRPLQAIAVPA